VRRRAAGSGTVSSPPASPRRSRPGDEYRPTAPSERADITARILKEPAVPIHDSPLVGRPCWIDLFSSDPDRSRAFYAGLFGWTAHDTGPEYGGYVNFLRDDAMIAGMMRNDGAAGTPDAWTVYLRSDDARATVAAADANGGQVIVAPMAVGDLGTMAVVIDVGGAAVGVWQPNEFGGFGASGVHGSPAWFELLTRDYDKAVEFYRTVFGWQTHVMSDEPTFRYTTLGEDRDAVAGLMAAEQMLPPAVPAYWALYIQVDDTDATLARATELGGSVIRPAEDTPYGRLAQLADPTGAAFAVMGVRAED
jgi:predicted enzyme related to lactoylglutathione lyase